MSKRCFRSMNEILEEYFPKAVKARKLKIETPKEAGSRIVAEIVEGAKKMLEGSKNEGACKHHEENE